MNLDSETARYCTNVVIDNFEGGYYHPNMKSKLKGGENMGDSGETMFGIDFKHGGSLGESDFAKEVHAFFEPYNSNANAYGDKANGKKYASAAQGERWRQMVADLMLALFRRHFSNYLSSAAQSKLLNDKSLFLEMWYATWNGETHFKNMANIFNNAASLTPQEINNKLLTYRYARTKWNATPKMDTITAQWYGKANNPTKPKATTANNGSSSKKKGGLLWLLLIGAAAIYLINKK